MVAPSYPMTSAEHARQVNPPAEIGDHLVDVNDMVDTLARQIAYGPSHVRWHGAAGDGVADDTVALQECIDYCARVGLGAVILGRGVYKITETLVDSNETDDDSFGSTIRIIGVGSSEVSTDTPLSRIVTDGAIVGIRFNGNRSGGENFIIEGDNGAADGASHGVQVESSRAYWKNVVSQKHRGDGFKFRFGNCSHFEHILVLSNKGNGFNVDGTGYETPAGVSRPNDANACTFISIDARSNGGAGLRTGVNSTFSNNYYNVTSQGNTGYGIEVNGDWNTFFGVYVEGNEPAASPATDVHFAATADNNYIYGLYSNYDGVSDNKYEDLSTNQRNYVSTLTDYSDEMKALALQVGNKTGGINGWLQLKEGSTNHELTLEGTSASMQLDITSAGAGTLSINPDAIVTEGWTAPTLLNSWVNYGGSRQTAGYYKDKTGRVHLRGVIKDGTATNPTALITLPSGYRPTAREYFAVSSNGAFGSVFIDSDGNVYFEAGSNASLSLCGISFKVG